MAVGLTRKTYGVFLVVAFGILAVIIWSSDSDNPDQIVGISVDMPAKHSLDDSAGSFRRDPLHTASRFVLKDAITNTPLRPPAGIISVMGERLEINSPVFDLPNTIQASAADDFIALIEYYASDLPSARRIRRQLVLPASPLTSQQDCIIPYQSKLLAFARSLSTNESLEATASACLIDDGTWDAALDNDNIPGASIFLRTSLQHKIQVYESYMGPLPWVMGTSTADGGSQVLLPGSGRVLCRIECTGFRPVLIETATVEGAVREETVVLVRRPIISGRVLTVDGSPAHGAQVLVKVVLDDTNFDFFQSDIDAGVAAASAGELHREIRVVDIPFPLDSEGYFSGPIPSGSKVAIWASVSESQFAFIELDQPARGEAIQAPTLFLTDYSNAAENKSIRVYFKESTGESVTDATIIYAILADRPWYRTFPPQITDAAGGILVHGIPAGTDVAFIIQDNVTGDVVFRSQSLTSRECVIIK